MGAGDIANCHSGGKNHVQTAKLLDTIGGTVFTLGDNAYMSGTAREFAECYEPTWGRHKSRTRPVPGNHDWDVNPAPYFSYFGANAGPSGLGYYSFDLGAWHIIALNSETDTRESSPQGVWLRDDLAASTAKCTLAYWHRPLFTSGPNGDNPKMRPFWQMLYTTGAEIVLTGHDHLYERFAPQDPDGRPDPVRGIRQFIVGTGGIDFYRFATTKPNSEVRRADAWGVLRLTLNNDTYQWDFITTTTSGPLESGTGTCH